MNEDAGEALLASLFAGTESDDDSEYNPDDSVGSAGTEGDSQFDELSIASGDLQDVYGQRMGRPTHESDEHANARAANLSDSDGESTISDAEERAVAALQRMAVSGRLRSSTSIPTLPCPSQPTLNNPAQAQEDSGSASVAQERC